MTSSFVETDEEFNEELRNTSGNKNTKRSTDYWTNIFPQWAKTRGKNEQLESCEVPELNEALARFFAELRKENGKDCEPESPAQANACSCISPSKKQKLSQGCRERYRVPIVKKRLRRKLKEVREPGIGKRPNKAQSLTKEEEEIL